MKWFLIFLRSLTLIWLIVCFMNCHNNYYIVNHTLLFYFIISIESTLIKWILNMNIQLFSSLYQKDHVRYLSPFCEVFVTTLWGICHHFVSVNLNGSKIDINLNSAEFFQHLHCINVIIKTWSLYNWFLETGLLCPKKKVKTVCW